MVAPRPVVTLPLLYTKELDVHLLRSPDFVVRWQWTNITALNACDVSRNKIELSAHNRLQQIKEA